MSVFIPLKVRVIRALVNDATAITLMLAVFALLLATGFVTTSLVNTPNYFFMLQLVGFKVWAVAFAAYGILKLFSCLYRTYFMVGLATSVVGMWLWSYTILSFTLFDSTPLLPIDFIIITTLFVEVWSFSLLIYYHTNPIYRRITDANKRSLYYSPSGRWVGSSTNDYSIGAPTSNKDVEER